jgi:hypothetical protein
MTVCLRTLLVLAASVLLLSCGSSRPRDENAPEAASVQSISVAAGASGCSFSLSVHDGISWLVDPDGKRFFSLGVCVVDRGIAPGEYDPGKPGYASWRHYPDPAAWANATLRRLRSWRFTTIGGWSDAAALRGSRLMDLALAPVLGAGMEAGVPWFDLWDREVVGRVQALTRERIFRVRDYPRLLGFYSDNEMGWWNGALFKMTLEHPATSGQRCRLLEMLRGEYAGSWDALLADFDPEGAAGFSDLDRGGLLHLRPGRNGIRVARRFLALVAERYYELLGALLRLHASRALVLGDRYQSFYYPEVARAAGRHVDVVSTNLNAQWNDGSFARFYLETLHELAGKPVVVSEFYAAAVENRSGNPNDRGLFPVAGTQEERAEACRRTLEALLSLPYVVGADWFQYYDEPPGGRRDGENFNFGLVDIEDRPYEELTRVFRGLDAAAMHRRASRERLDASHGVPPAPAEPFADFEPNRALLRWDRERGFVRPSSRLPLADLYLAWSAEGLYLGFLTLDPVEGAYYRDGRVPEADRAEWRVEIEGLEEPVAIRIGAGREPAGVPEGMRAVSLSGEKVNVRVVAALHVPAARFGRDRLAVGDSIRLSSALTAHARAQRTEWKGTFRFAE